MDLWNDLSSGSESNSPKSRGEKGKWKKGSRKKGSGKKGGEKKGPGKKSGEEKGLRKKKEEEKGSSSCFRGETKREVDSNVRAGNVEKAAAEVAVTPGYV